MSKRDGYSRTPYKNIYFWFSTKTNGLFLTVFVRKQSSLSLKLTTASPLHLDAEMSTGSRSSCLYSMRLEHLPCILASIGPKRKTQGC